MVWKLISLTSFVFNIPEEVKKNPERGGLALSQKTSVTLVGLRRNCFSWNHLKYPEKLNVIEVGNVNFQHKYVFVT